MRFTEVRAIIGSALALTLLCLVALPSRASAEPDLRLLYTANVRGYIDQCGCRYNPSGGIARRATMIKEMDSAPHLLLDGGEVTGYSGEIEHFTTWCLFRAMKRMGYHTIGVGPRDLQYGVAFLREAEEQFGFAFTSANLIDDATGEPFFAPYTVETVEGSGLFGAISTRKVGVISVMGADRPPFTIEGDPTLRVADPVETVREMVGEIRDDVDILVVMASVAPEVLEELTQIDGIDVLCVARYVRVPEGDWVRVQNGVAVAYQSYQGRGLVNVDIDVDSDGGITSVDGDITFLTEDVEYDAELLELKEECEERVAEMEAEAGSGAERSSGE